MSPGYRDLTVWAQSGRVPVWARSRKESSQSSCRTLGIKNLSKSLDGAVDRLRAQALEAGSTGPRKTRR
jgi:hypothetical protein